MRNGWRMVRAVVLASAMFAFVAVGEEASSVGVTAVQERNAALSEFMIDARKPGLILPNAWQTVTLWHLPKDVFARAKRNAESDILEFVEFVEVMGATGGDKNRDCFKDPENLAVQDDYDFSRLVEGCRRIVKMGLKPYLKLGNVPWKLASMQDGGTFRMNIRPPDDYTAYRRYMEACAQALLDAFGRDELLRWRFAVLTEFENFGWFKDVSGEKDKTCLAYCRLYEVTAEAFTRVISPDVTIGAHAEAGVNENDKSHWDERRFIQYAAAHGLPLKFLAASYYDVRPGAVARADKGLPRKIAHLRAAAESAGFTNLYYAVDEGRVLFGSEKKRQIPLGLRIVGDTWQAAFDARIVRQIFDSGAEYMASWGFLSGPDRLFEGLPSVSFHVARESAKFKGMRRISVNAVKHVGKDAETDAVAALSPDGRTLLLMVYAFIEEPLKAKGNYPVRLSFDLPLAWRGDVRIVRKMVVDDANWFDEWRKDRVARGIGDDRFCWSPDDPAPMSSCGFKRADDRRMFVKEIEPKLRQCSRMKSSERQMRISKGETLAILDSLPANAVLFLELSNAQDQQKGMK